MSDSWGGQDQPPADRPNYDAPPPGYIPPGSGQPLPAYGQPPYGQPPYGQGGGPQGYGPGGYGPPMAPVGGWAPPAPMPGGVPLRPLSVGDILSGAFTLIRRNPVATLGLAAIIETVAGIVTTFFSWSEQKLTHHLTTSLGPNATSTQTGHAFVHFFTSLLPYLGLTAVVTIVVQGALTGALTGALGRGLIGDKVTIGEAMRMARMPTVIWVSVLIPIILLIPWLIVGLLVGALILIKLKAVALILGIVGYIALIPVTIWIAVRLLLTQPVVVLEVAGPVAAMRRSWQLVQGKWWRTFGIYLLATLVVLVISGIISFPFSLVGILTGGGTSFFGGLKTTGPTLLAIAVSGIGGIIATTCTRPISAGVLVLQYADLRMRKEGLDLVLQQAGQSPGMSGTEFSNVWQPGRAQGQGAGQAFDTGAGPVGTGPGAPGPQGW